MVLPETYLETFSDILCFDYESKCLALYNKKEKTTKTCKILNRFLINTSMSQIVLKIEIAVKYFFYWHFIKR